MNGLNPLAGQASSARAGSWRRGLRALVVELLSTLLPALLVALLIQAFLVQSTIVYGQSMEPNLRTDQRLMVEKISYRVHGPRRGDIVVLQDPTGGPIPLVKRVVGLPGERITLAHGRVYVDGALLDEPYLDQGTAGEGRSWLVPPMQIFVMGDNRSHSKDSRYFGTVPLDAVIGHAIFRLWPHNQLGALP
jgi:signal peptidase I